MNRSRIVGPWFAAPTLSLLVGCGLCAGPYSSGLNDPFNTFDAPVPGFVGPAGDGKARLSDGQGGFTNASNYVNPLFFRWGLGWSDYLRSDGSASFSDPSLALGPVTGNAFDVVSLGDLSATQIAAGNSLGRVTLSFTDATRTNPIRNLPGADFVVFENATISQYNTGGAGVGGVFAELAYVEVSSDGINFARFPSVSLTPSSVGPYGSLDPTNVVGLAGKHVNAYGDSWGTPFDLDALKTNVLVVSGQVDLNSIRYVRIVDIPGNGSFFDTATPTHHPIYDPWLTTGSGGFDLEAIGAISVPTTFSQWQDWNGLSGTQRGALADPDGDGISNLVEYAFAGQPLVADAQNLPAIILNGNDAAISFRRDVRATDLTLEVLAGNDLTHWDVIASSTAGGDVLPVAPFNPVIEDSSDSRIASVGVIRRVRVHDVQSLSVSPHRFLKVRVIASP